MKIVKTWCENTKEGKIISNTTDINLFADL